MQRQTIFARQAELETRRAHVAWRWQSLGNGLYIIAYHSIWNPAQDAEWERAYTKVATGQSDFADHIAWLASHMTLLSTSEALHLTAQQMQRGRYAVVHFDDAYLTLQTNAREMVAQYGVRPTVFVNGAFADGQMVYYRVLAALMLQRGQAETLRTALHDAGFQPSDDVFAYLKNHYRAAATEAAVQAAWLAANPHEDYPRAHLNWGELRALQAEGWEIGNHTREHLNLCDLDETQHDEQIMENEAMLAANGLEPRPWLAYPNGLLQHVGAATATWLAEHQHYHAFFGGGGVNLQPTRVAWLRILVGDWNQHAFRRQVAKERSRMM